MPNSIKITRIGTTTSVNSKIVIEEVGGNNAAALSANLHVLADPLSPNRIVITDKPNRHNPDAFYLDWTEVDYATSSPTFVAADYANRTAFITALATNFFCRA